MYRASTPYLIQAFFNKLVWNIPSPDKTVYLTFDDGPTPKVTAWVLKILEDYSAMATFFCIGKNVAKQRRRGNPVNG